MYFDVIYSFFNSSINIKYNFRPRALSLTRDIKYVSKSPTEKNKSSVFSLTLLHGALLGALAASQVHDLLMHRIQSVAVEGADCIY